MRPRMSAPQTYHLHVLLKGGEQAMEALAPGFLARLEAAGSVPLDPGHDFFSASELGVAKPFETPMRVHGQSRWLLEHCLRQQVCESTAKLTMRSGVTVRGLVTDAAGTVVKGVRLETAAGTEETLSGDLVVDASGRGEGAIRWLKALGLPEPPVETVKVSFGYASTVVRLGDDLSRSWKAVVVGNLPRDGARGGVLMPIEGGRHICSLGGRAGDYPPDDEAGFLEFAKALPNPALYEALAGATFEAPISKLIYPANRLRNYAAMAQRPRGFVPVGDALCSFNPTYGQGMSSAALQAKALSEALAGAGDLQARLEAYLAQAAEVVALAVAPGELQRLPLSHHGRGPGDVYARGNDLPHAGADGGPPGRSGARVVRGGAAFAHALRAPAGAGRAGAGCGGASRLGVPGRRRFSQSRGGLEMLETITTEMRDGVLLITLNRPERLNAWTYKMGAELAAAVSAGNDDPEVLAMVVTGAGRGLCRCRYWRRLCGTGSGERARVPRDWVGLVRF